ncbi:MAG: thermonuclease family protein [Pseudomonadota bacterium]
MIDILTSASVILFAALAGYYSGALGRAGRRGTVLVERVLDGESFQLDRRFDGFLNVRIAGVRAPAGAERGAGRAAEALEALVAGKMCRLRPVDEDPDGFLIAEVAVDDRDVADELVRQGCAVRSKTLFRGAFRRPDEV